MCLICVDFQKEVLTITEAWHNLQEMKDGMTDEHYDEVVSLIIDKLYEDQIEADADEELASLMETLEEDGQLSFGLDHSPDLVDELHDDLNNPWYIPGYED